MRNTREENFELNLKEYKEGKLTLNSLPIVIFVELTQNCNLNCRMCRSGMRYNPKLDMSESVFSLIAKELLPTAHFVDLRGWGESTILRDFNKRLQQTISTGVKLRLVTNALSLKEKTWELLMSAGASVVVSFDASKPETTRYLGRGSLDRILRSINIGLEEKRRARAGEISFNTVLNSVNLYELPEILRIAGELQINKITLFPIVASRKNPLHLCHVKSDIPKVIELATKVAFDYRVELRLGASLDENFVLKDNLMKRCSHPWSVCYIDYAGRVGYCDHLIGHPDLTLGDLNESCFESIWNGKRFQNLRKRHLLSQNCGNSNIDSSLLSHCEWCYYRRYVDFEDEIFKDHENRVVSTRRSLPLLGKSIPSEKTLDFLSKYI